MSYDETNKLDHALNAAADALDDVLETVADEIHRHANLRTRPTHHDIARWACAIDCATQAVESVERAIAARKIFEPHVSMRLQ